MTVEALKAEAAKCRAHGLDTMAIVIPRGFKRPPRWPRGERQRLFDNPDGGTVYRISIDKLLAWVEWAEGQDEMDAEPRGSQ